MKKRIVILTGAGMSAESGFQTFRDAGGLWEQHSVDDVATPEGWNRNSDLVTTFYNGLRRQLIDAQPNAGHFGLAAMEEIYDVRIITQNVDDLHERAGSSHVLHLHGDLMEVCSSIDPNNPNYRYRLSPDEVDVPLGAKAADGSLLRPWIVWFGESVPNLVPAMEEVRCADVFVIIGSSLNVYPANSLIHYVPSNASIYIIDPKPVSVQTNRHINIIEDVATSGVVELRKRLSELDLG